MAQPAGLPRPEGTPWGTWWCGSCGYSEEGHAGEALDCPNCTDPGGLPEGMTFQADDDPWDEGEDEGIG